MNMITIPLQSSFFSNAYTLCHNYAIIIETELSIIIYYFCTDIQGYHQYLSYNNCSGTQNRVVWQILHDLSLHSCVICTLPI